MAQELTQVIKKKMEGIVHITGEEKMSMYELAKITTPDIGKITLKDVDVPLSRDMSLSSIRLKPLKLLRT